MLPGAPERDGNLDAELGGKGCCCDWEVVWDMYGKKHTYHWAISLQMNVTEGDQWETAQLVYSEIS